MSGYLRRLLAGSAAYQAASILSAAFAVLTLPLYTRSLTPSDYGYAETLLTFIILTSILLRLGLGEAFVRFWFDDEDPARRRRLAQTTTATVALTSVAVGGLGLVFAGPLSRLLLGREDATLMACGLLGLVAFTNLEVAYALLRVQERRTAYVAASCANVCLTVGLTVLLVLGLDGGARGYVLGNYAASTVVLLALWWSQRGLIALRVPSALGPLLRYGAPTIPADAAVFALNVVDRAYLLRAQSPAAAGVYAVAVKLSTAVIIAVRGFQAAWPPLAYSVSDEDEARRLYAFVTTAYVLVTGTAVAAITLLGRWLVRLLAAPEFFAAHAVLPWVALGWSLYGLNLVFVTIAGRARVTARTFPGAVAGLAVNVLVLVALVPSLGIRGAGIAVCAAYVVTLVSVHLLTRNAFAVPFEVGRLTGLVAVLAAVAVGGELLLPTHGVAGLASRAAALALIPLALHAGRFLSDDERARVAALVRSARSRRGGGT